LKIGLEVPEATKNGEIEFDFFGKGYKFNEFCTEVLLTQFS